VGVKGVDESCHRFCEVLQQYPLDIPYAAIYLLAEGVAEAQRLASTQATSGTIAPAILRTHDSGLHLAQLIATEQPQLFTDRARQPDDVLPGLAAEAVQQTLLLPLKGAGQRGLAGCLLVGISARRPLDDAYRSFLELVAGQMAAAIADAQAFEAQRQRAEALAELDRAKTTFFSNVSHEFRTPLTLMLGPVEESLKDPRVPREVRSRLRLAQRNSVRLLKLVDSLLDFSRIEAGRMQATYEATDLVALTRDLASTFRSAIERAGLRYGFHAGDIVEPAYVDREMWEKIVLNLISNAFKFTLHGSIDVHIRADGGHAVLQIADTGGGIPDHELPRLFERFHRVEGAEARTNEGSGIGLALVQELIRLHEGTIDVTSTLERGTSFSVCIPFGSAHLPADHVRLQRDRMMTGSGAQAFVQEALRWLPDSGDGATASVPVLSESDGGVADKRFAATFGARILIADDNADMRAYLRDLASPLYRVETAADGEQASRPCEHNPPICC
jgi:signal transduction histidine kinase